MCIVITKYTKASISGKNIFYCKNACYLILSMFYSVMAHVKSKNISLLVLYDCLWPDDL